jgi:hypothetical protein
MLFGYPFKGSSGMEKKIAKCISLNKTEVEFIALTETSKDLLWLK